MGFLSNITSKAKDRLGGKAQPDFSTKPYPGPKDPQNEDGAYSIKIVMNSLDNGKEGADKKVIRNSSYVIARLSSSFKLGVRSEWDSLSSGLSGGLAKAADLTLGAAYGYSLKTQILTAQYWTGNAPIEFTIPLQFKALNDAKKEVVLPLKTLMKAALPTTGEFNFLIPPGPNILAASFTELKRTATGLVDVASSTIKDFFGKKGVVEPTNQSELKKQLQNTTSAQNLRSNGIDLWVGKFFHATNLIIVNVDCDIKTLMSNDEVSLPMSIDCDVTFRTVFAPTAEDINNWFLDGIND